MLKAIKILGLALAVLWLPAPALAQGKDGATSPAVFLLATPESGPLAELGLKARQGAELALNIWGGGFKLQFLNESQADSLEAIDLSAVALVLGYFTENRFAVDAPRYLYLRKPVLLPYLANAEAAARGPGLFFRLMPTARDQGRFLALEILKLRRRPSRLLLVTGAAPAQAALVEALTETLARPARAASADKPTSADKPMTADKPAPADKPASNIKPLDAHAQVVTLSLDQVLAPEGLARFGRNKPELVVLALDRAEALRLAPRLAKEGYEKIPLWGALSLGFREIGAGFASLSLNLQICLPAANLAVQDTPAVREITRQFIDAYKAHPTWISALAFDSLDLAVKAASIGEGAQGLVDFLAGGRHHGLSSYDLGPEGDGSAGLALMTIRPANLGFLP
jgi:hypothetical protein